MTDGGLAPDAKRGNPCLSETLREPRYRILPVAKIQCMFEKTLAITVEVYWVIVYTTTASWQIESPCTDA